MKKILKFILLISFFGCEKHLEIIPDYKFPSELATSNLDSLESITNGIFNQLQSGNLLGGGLIANSELLADNWDSGPYSDFSLNQLRTRDMNSYNGEASGLWNDGYRAINMCNIVLNYLPNFENENIQKVENLRSECLFIRAVCHFEMLRMFAQPAGFNENNSHLGIPIRFEMGSATEGQSTPRSSVAQVYEFIIQDLENSIQYLPSDRLTRVSKWAAMSYLAKINFQKHDYEQALYWCNEVIQSNEFSLNSSVKEIYDLSGWIYSNESIFQIINIAEDNSNGKIVGRLKSTSVVYNQEFDSIINYIDDKRKSELYTFFGVPYLKKYSNGSMNVTIIRLSELYLTRAECKVRVGGYSDSEIRNDYNILIERANGAIDNNTSGFQNLINKISLERNIELGFEGDRFHDLKRKKQNFNTNLGVYDWNSPKLIYPIPQQEIDQNPNMIQNEGY